MNYAPINGLRVLAVETGLLVALFALAFLVLRLFRSRPLPRWLAWILASRPRSVWFVIVVALLGRALLLPFVGIPEPRINDEYSNLLMADTFAHFRLANPTPPLWQHFETFHVNFTPTYHGKYPVAQAMFMAFGQVLFHQPWVGIWLSTALMCGAICWALQAFFSPGWALLGGLLAVARFALLSYWVNSYWGGSVSALGGALALGAVVRLFSRDFPPKRLALTSAVFAIGLVTLATSRPFEGLAFSIPLLAYFGYHLVRALTHQPGSFQRMGAPALVIGLVVVGGMAYYNRQTTGNPLLLPYVLNERTYSSLPLFFGQKPRPVMQASDPIFPRYYEIEAQEHGYAETNTLAGLAGMQLRRLALNWFFYIGVVFSFPALVGFLACLTQPRMRIVIAVTLTTGAAVAACIFTQVHYFAPATIVVYLFVIEGLRQFWQQEHAAERAFVIAVCLTAVVTALLRQSGATTLNTVFAFPDTRSLITRQLADAPGKQLILVFYDFAHHYPGDELVHNGPDFDAQKILWARSKGDIRDRELCSAYGDRSFWMVSTDDQHWSMQPVQLCKTGEVSSHQAN